MKKKSQWVLRWKNKEIARRKIKELEIEMKAETIIKKGGKKEK